MKSQFTLTPEGKIVRPKGLGVEAAPFFCVPGMVNAHSHSFQRALRGLVEKPKVSGQDDFWSWREMMYGIARKAKVDDFETLAMWCFLDCLKSGFTHVGEFHYVHHRADGTPYQPTYKVAQKIVRAAQRLGLRLTMLHTAYHANGPQQPANKNQLQFIFPTVASFLQHVEAATEELHGSLMRHGVALHSIRACPRDWMAPIAEFARKKALPLHVHASEQISEVEACQKAYGMTPVALLHAEGVLHNNCTVIHGTHVSNHDIELLASTGTTVCICPSTERNLGDGMAPILDYIKSDIPLSIGTDSHARIDVVDELRSLEDHERLRLQKRLVWLECKEDLALGLIPVACKNGYHSLNPYGLNGDANDRVWIEVPSHLEGCAPSHIVHDWLIGGSSHAVQHVEINGDWILKNRESVRIDEQALSIEVNALLKHLALP